jgi:hypothetical protein
MVIVSHELRRIRRHHVFFVTGKVK